MATQDIDIERINQHLQDLYETFASQPVHAVLDGLSVHEPPAPWNADNSAFSEHFLQILWNERYLLDSLVCQNGATLQIIHQGDWNVSAGPDFHDAALILNGKLIRGDVEIHPKTSDWLHHAHQHDPLYRNVVLHVVWHDDGPIPDSPENVLVLCDFLNPAWKLLLHEVENACYPYARQLPPGKCAIRWALTDNDKIQEILAAAGLARFESKTARFARQAASQDPDQTLYEFVFECLGYQHNKAAFRQLAASLPLTQVSQYENIDDLEAIFFGTAGLLPDSTMQDLLPQWKERAPQLWNRWWQLGASKLNLPWIFAATRPLNSPHRRLAAGIKWLSSTDFRPLQWLQNLAAKANSSKQLLNLLFNIDFDLPHWRGCQNFKTPVKPASALLGRSRLADIIANIFLPALCAQNSPNYSPEIAHLANGAFLTLPPMQGNRSLTEAAHRFLMPPSRAREVLKRACHQQGLLDIYRNFCQNLGHDCSKCPFANLHGQK